MPLKFKAFHYFSGRLEFHNDEATLFLEFAKNLAASMFIKIFMHYKDGEAFDDISTLIFMGVD